MTARQFILLKINVLRSSASPAHGNATAKEGHVNFDVFDVPVKVRAAPTTGSGCATTCCQMFFLVVTCARSDGSSANPPPAQYKIEGLTCGVLEGGWASLVGEVTLPCCKEKLLTVRETEVSSLSRYFW